MEVDSDAPKVSAADKAKAVAAKEKGTAAYKQKDFETALQVYRCFFFFFFFSFFMQPYFYELYFCDFFLFTFARSFLAFTFSHLFSSITTQQRP